MDFKNEKALHYIDLALNLDKSHSNNWDIKAIVLEGMKDIRMIYTDCRLSDDVSILEDKLNISY